MTTLAHGLRSAARLPGPLVLLFLVDLASMFILGAFFVVFAVSLSIPVAGLMTGDASSLAALADQPRLALLAAAAMAVLLGVLVVSVSMVRAATVAVAMHAEQGARPALSAMLRLMPGLTVQITVPVLIELATWVAAGILVWSALVQDGVVLQALALTVAAAAVASAVGTTATASMFLAEHPDAGLPAALVRGAASLPSLLPELVPIGLAYAATATLLATVPLLFSGALAQPTAGLLLLQTVTETVLGLAGLWVAVGAWIAAALVARRHGLIGR